MSAPPSVLYDAPGPRARRRARILSAASIVVFAVIGLFVVLRLQETGQFEADRWAPLYWPPNEDFPLVWERILTGLATTLLAAALAITFSLVLGTALTVARLMLGRTARFPLVVVAEVLRGSPVVLLIFFAWRVLPQAGIELSLLWYLVVGLTAYNFVVIGEILRAGVAALPRGQREAGLAVGLSPRQTLMIVQLPQAFRLMLPALISQLVVIVKDTSLAAIVLIGPEELLTVGGQLAEFFRNPLQTYLLIAVIYILVNSLLGRIAVMAERRLSSPRGRRPAHDPALQQVMARQPVAGTGE
jgi:glutamate transport system permease protein